MNQIIFGDNLPLLHGMPNASVDLIYIDPPFNTGKTQKRKTIKTTLDSNGDRKGFKGNKYQTTVVGEKEYKDNFSNIEMEGLRLDIGNSYLTLEPYASKFFIEGFLYPRLMEAYRILKPTGSLYFHIDYREVHYCKILLDRIFGRDSFINEIIWAYDFGGRAKSKWPAKHDNILLYVKNPDSYIFNTNELDREKYMAPGLVGPEKAELGKLPTDTWWYPYVGNKSADTWWHTIVGTSSHERTGYPTQKPIGVINRIIKASSLPGNVVLDFFAGSGTVGQSCLTLDRKFILIDNNIEALEVMAERFNCIKDIEWVNFDPKPIWENIHIPKKLDEFQKRPNMDDDLHTLIATANYLQKDLEKQSDVWKESPFEWVVQLPARKKGKLGQHLVASWLKAKGFPTQKTRDTSSSLILENKILAIKFSTLWGSGSYKFQQIRDNGHDFVVCFGISPFDAHCWFVPREVAIKYATIQHKGAKGAEYWIEISPNSPPDWANEFGGTLNQAFNSFLKLFKLEH